MHIGYRYPVLTPHTEPSTMSSTADLITVLKQELKLAGITYAQLAVALGLAESSVKRMFALVRFSIDRVIEIAHLLGFTLAELTHEAAASESRLHTLSDAQERELVSEPNVVFFLSMACRMRFS